MLIKIENSRLLVKVGGGFTSIDEFLWIYTSVELENSENSPKSKKFESNFPNRVRFYLPINFYH